MASTIEEYRFKTKKMVDEFLVLSGEEQEKQAMELFDRLDVLRFDMETQCGEAYKNCEPGEIGYFEDELLKILRDAYVRARKPQRVVSKHYFSEQFCKLMIEEYNVEAALFACAHLGGYPTRREAELANQQLYDQTLTILKRGFPSQDSPDFKRVTRMIGDSFKLTHEMLQKQEGKTKGEV